MIDEIRNHIADTLSIVDSFTLGTLIIEKNKVSLQLAIGESIFLNENF
jgi:hypothetical protein